MLVTRAGVTAAVAALSLSIPTAAVADPGRIRPPNPYVSMLPDLTKADYVPWAKRLHAQGRARAKSTRLRRVQAKADPGRRTPAIVHDEEEPLGTGGVNDSVADAERIRLFGTRRAQNHRLRILGNLMDFTPPAPSNLPRPTEDNGAIPLAVSTRIAGSGAIQTWSRLGDGPHGSSGDGSNDFDFYSLDVAAGRSIVASTAGTLSGTDTVLAVYDARGELMAVNDDFDFDLLSQVTYTPDSPGTYYVMVAGYSFEGSLPADPFDSGSGAGFAAEGDYRLTISAQRVDNDYFAVRLRPGDVLGGVARGTADGLAIVKPDGTRMVGSTGLDASFLYPATSPLPGGGNTTLAYVAEEPGWYAVQPTGAPGRYDLTVEAYRPGTEGDRGRRQTVLLDFDPGRVQTGTWGGPGARDVSPFRSFVPRWGIARSRTRRLERAVLDTVRANLQREVQASGLNRHVDVEVLDARQHPELVGRRNVSHIYVAGSIAETWLDTIGIAETIDPGNFGHEDEAIVLLDVLSGDPDELGDASLNYFMNSRSHRVRFVAQAVGNIVAHEVGHTVGSFHTEFSNDVHNLMDSGGGFFGENLFGVGPDMVGGTADDENIRFRTDDYSAFEGFTGLENTKNVTAWAYAGR